MKVAHLSEPAEERVIYRDGLGVREWRDTGTGELVEWFHLDPAFAAVETPLRDRVTRLAKLQHVKFARILGLEPAPKNRGPILVSSHVPGSRLADVLEMAGHGLITFEPGAGLQVLRDVLSALAVLHDSRNVAHGSLGPERVVLTATGRVVMVEHVLAQALDRLQRPRHQLWREWRVPTPPAAGTVRFDMTTDLAQAGLLGLTALLGRPLEEEEYPHRLRGLLPLVQDRLAQSPAAAIAGDVVALLERLAPLDSRRAFKTVREAQQAYEGLFSGGAAALGASPARVKGVVAAVTAIAATKGSASSAALPKDADPVVAEVRTRNPPATPAASSTTAAPGTPTTATTARSHPAEAESESALEAEIDIEALLALEAELEGGTAPSAPGPDPQRRPAAPAPRTDKTSPVTAPRPAEDDRPLEALAQERLDLERQFAQLVASVAPVAAEAVHLIPETPSTSEPLVDARVLWSSMPADDAGIALATADSDVAPPLLDLTPPSEMATAAENEDDAPVPFADTSVFSGLEPESDTEPLLAVAAEEPRPAAAIDHVPAEWWKEALPWRDEDASEVLASEAGTAAGAVGVPNAHEAPAASDASDVSDADDSLALVATEVLAETDVPQLVTTADDDLITSHFVSVTDVIEVVNAVESVDASATDAADANADDGVTAPVDVDALHAGDAGEETDAAIDGVDAADLVEPEGDADVVADRLIVDANVAVTVDLVGPGADDDGVVAETAAPIDLEVADASAAADQAEAAGSLLGDLSAEEITTLEEEITHVEFVGALDAGDALAFDDLEARSTEIAGDEVTTVDLGVATEPVDVAAAIHAAGINDADDMAPLLETHRVEDLLMVREPEPSPDFVHLAEVDAGVTFAAEMAIDHAAVDEEEATIAPEVAGPVGAVVLAEEAVPQEGVAVEEVTPVDDGTITGAPEGLQILDVVAGAVSHEAVGLIPAQTLPADDAQGDAAPAVEISDADETTAAAPIGETGDDLAELADVDATSSALDHIVDTVPAPAVDSADIDWAPVETTAADATSIVAADASPDADVNVGGDNAMAPSGDYRLFADIEPILLQPDADAESTRADSPFGLQPVDDAPAAAAAALLSRGVGTEATADWRDAFVGADAGAARTSDGFFAQFEALTTEPSWDCERDAEVTPIGSPADLELPVLVVAATCVDVEAVSAALPAAEMAAPAELPESADAGGATDQSDPVLLPDGPPVTEPPAPFTQPPAVDPPATLPESVPEVVIVDDGHDGSGWDNLPSELPDTSDGLALPVESVVTDAADAHPEQDDDVGDASGSVNVAGSAASKKKRRRSRRKKGAATVAAPVPVVMEAPMATRLPSLAPAPLTAVPAAIVIVADEARPESDTSTAHPTSATPMAISLTPTDSDSAAEDEQMRPEMAARQSSLLGREVPAWTPPSDLGSMRTRVVPPPTGQSTATALPEIATAAATDDSAATSVVVGVAAPAAMSAPTNPQPVPVPSPIPLTSASPSFGAPEGLRPFEQEIRAVGMPDPEEVQPRTGRGNVSGAGDPLSGSGMNRGSAPEPWATTQVTQPQARRGINWRRLIAASVLIAVFQGVAFAAWWWVQPGVRGTLVVQTAKSGVEVLLDDKVVGRTPFREEVAPGRHRLKLRQGDNIREMPVEISVGVVTTQALEWPSSSGGKGNLQVTSNPAGAEIVRDGKVLGATPLLLENLPAGDHVLVLRGDAGSVSVNATVVADETTPLEVKIFAGWILVDAPVEVNLLLNGREKIGSSMDGQILLPPGTHRLRAVNEALGIRQWLTVNVEPGAVQRVPFSVAPGTLTLHEDGEVFLDGVSAGTTPRSIKVPPGTHEIVLRLADGTERRQAMTVRSGQRVEF